MKGTTKEKALIAWNTRTRFSEEERNALERVIFLARYMSTGKFDEPALLTVREMLKEEHNEL